MKVKDYNTETDIITTPDPIFYREDHVALKNFDSPYKLQVESVSWDYWAQTWVYTLVYFLTEGDGSDMRWNGSLALESAREKDLSLISRPRKTLSVRKTTGK